MSKSSQYLTQYTKDFILLFLLRPAAGAGFNIVIYGLRFVGDSYL